jgi:AcrR family transcriptional regulator
MGSTPPVAAVDRSRQLAAVAKQLLDAEGPEAMTMRRVADSVGITAPALYRYFADKSELEDAVISEAHWELGDLCADRVARSRATGLQALRVLVGAYREWAVAHPHLYRLVYCSPLSRNCRDPAAERYGAEQLLEACGGDLEAAQRIWVAVHGLVMLELDGRMTDQMDPAALLEQAVVRLGPAA